jgi:hypothetical protein
MQGQLIKIKQGSSKFQTIFTNAADEVLAAQLPPLELPPMGEQARAAFRALLQYEKPGANGSVVDVLQLVEARGFHAHPCDWIPEYSWQLGGRHPKLYQPWVDWLSEHGFTKFHSGNTLTPENCKRWSPGQRNYGLTRIISEGKHDGFIAAKALAATQPASIRAEMVGVIEAGGMFSGCYPWQTPLLEYFLEDKAASVRDIAAQKLAKMGAFTTEDAYAQKLASEITVTSDCVRYKNPTEFPDVTFMVDFACVSFDTLASAIGLSANELAQRVELEVLGKQVIHLAVCTSDAEVRSILARRYLDKGVAVGQITEPRLFNGVAKPLWERGLKAMLLSPYENSVQDYLGDKTGTMNSATMREWSCSNRIAQSVTDELEQGAFTVNKAYDPLRVLGKVVDKQAACEVLDEALAAGMRPDNPRLTMLKLNLAL